MRAVVGVRPVLRRLLPGKTLGLRFDVAQQRVVLRLVVPQAHKGPRRTDVFIHVCLEAGQRSVRRCQPEMHGLRFAERQHAAVRRHEKDAVLRRGRGTVVCFAPDKAFTQLPCKVGAVDNGAAVIDAAVSAVHAQRQCDLAARVAKLLQRGVERAVRVILRGPHCSGDREALDHRPEHLGLALNGAVAVPAPLVFRGAAVERPVRFDLIAGVVRCVKECDDRAAHALICHEAPAGVGLLGLRAGALPFRLCGGKALRKLLDAEIRAGVVARVPELRVAAARPRGDRHIVVIAIARNKLSLALVGAAVAVRCRVQQVGNEHLR